MVLNGMLEFTKKTLSISSKARHDQFPWYIESSGEFNYIIQENLKNEASRDPENGIFLFRKVAKQKEKQNS